MTRELLLRRGTGSPGKSPRRRPGAAGPQLPRGTHTARALTWYGLFAAVRAVGLVLVAESLAAGIGLLAHADSVLHPGTPGTFGEPKVPPLLGASWALPERLLHEIAARGLTAQDFRAVLVLGLLGAFAQALAAWAGAVTARRAALGTKERVRSGVLSRVLCTGGADSPEGIGPTGVLVTRGLDDLDSYYTQTLTSLVSSAVVPLLVGLRIAGADWVSALVVVLTVPLVPVFMALIGVHTREATDASRAALARLSHHLVELAEGLPVLIGLGRAREMRERIEALSAQEHRHTMATLRIAFLSALVLELIASLSVAVVAVLVGVRLLAGSMTLDAGLIALILAPECYQPLRALGTAFHASADGLAAVRRVNAVLDTPVPEPFVLGAGPGGGAVRVRGLTVRFPGRGAPAVEGFSCVARAGTVTALTGPSGCGKTTVLRVLVGLLRPGTVLTGQTEPVSIAGCVSGLEPERIVWVPQEPRTVSGSVAGELQRYGADDRDAALRCLRRCAAGHLIHRDPAGLSPGELRRVGMARAFARLEALTAGSPRGITVLLDEPTAHLDPGTAEVVRQAVVRMRSDFPEAVVIVAGHDRRLVALADAVVALDRGSAVAHADHDNVLARTAPDGSATPAGASGAVPAGAAASLGASSGEAAQGLLRSREPQPAGAGSRSDPEGHHGSRLLPALRVLTGFVQPWRARWLAAVALGVLSAGFAIALTALSGWLIVAAAAQPPILVLLVAIVGVRFFGLGRAVLRYGERLTTHRAILASANRLRLRLWEVLTTHAIGSGRDHRAENTVARLVGDVDEARDLVPRTVLPVIVTTTVMIAAVVTTGLLLPDAWWVQVGYALVALVLAPAATVAADLRSTTAESRIRVTVLHRVLGALAAAGELRVNGADHRLLASLREDDAAATRAAQRSAWAQGAGDALVTAAGISAALACLWLAIPAVTAGSVSAPTAAAVILLQTALIAPGTEVTAAARLWPQLYDVIGRVTGDRTQPSPASGTTPTAPRDAVQQAASPRTPPGSTSGYGVTARLEDVTVRWPGTQRPALAGVTATVGTGRWLSVTGSSGSGKSTLLGVLLGFVVPSGGTVVWGGRGSTARPRCAWCPQDAHLFDSTVRSNLALARGHEEQPSVEELTRVLQRVGLGPWLEALPDGVDTRVGAGGAAVSGGQRQRIAVARALLTRAPVLLLDEPTAHLDEESARALMRDLRRTADGLAVVVVTHRDADIAPGDDVLRLG